MNPSDQVPNRLLTILYMEVGAPLHFLLILNDNIYMYFVIFKPVSSICNKYKTWVKCIVAI